MDPKTWLRHGVAAVALAAVPVFALAQDKAPKEEGEDVAPLTAEQLILRSVERDPKTFEDKAAAALLKKLKAEVAKERRAKPDDAARHDAASALADSRVAAVLDPLRRSIAAGETEGPVDSLWYLARGRPVPSKDKAEGEAKPAEAKEAAKPAKDDPEARLKAEAERLFKQRLKIRAMIMTGDLHMAGKGVIQNHSLARQWYLLAAKEGDIEAAYKLAHQFENAQGVPLSPERASEWYEAAAIGGHGPSMVRLAEMLALGLGIPADKVAARAWMEQAVAAGELVSADLVHALGMQDGTADAGKTAPKPDAAPDMTPEQMGEQMGGAMDAMAEGMGKGLAKMAEAMVQGLTKGMASGLSGGAPAAFTPIVPPPAARDLVDRYVTAVAAADLDGLKALFAPESLACITDKTRAGYDAGLERAFDNPPAKRDRYPIKMAEISPEGAVPYGAFLDYRIRPTHQLEVDLEAAEGGTAPLVTGLVRSGDGFAMVFPCLRGIGSAAPTAGTVAPADDAEAPAFTDRQAFVDYLLDRMKAKDQPGLRALLDPKVRACMTPETAPWFDFVEATLMAVDFEKETKVAVVPVAADEDLAGRFPVRPSHNVEITHDIRRSADGVAHASQSVSIEIGMDDGRWYLTPLCPGPQEMAMLPFAKAMLEGLGTMVEEMGKAVDEAGKAGQ